MLKMLSTRAHTRVHKMWTAGICSVFECIAVLGFTAAKRRDDLTMAKTPAAIANTLPMQTPDLTKPPSGTPPHPTPCRINFRQRMSLSPEAGGDPGAGRGWRVDRLDILSIALVAKCIGRRAGPRSVLWAPHRTLPRTVARRRAERSW